MTAADAATAHLARLSDRLPDMTADQLGRTAATWAALPGDTAAAARRLIECEMAWRERVARTNRSKQQRRNFALAGGTR